MDSITIVEESIEEQRLSLQTVCDAAKTQLERDPEAAYKVWNFLNDIDLQSLLGEGRVYGGGLYKLEPKELANVPADAIASLFPDERFTPNSINQTSLWGADEIMEKRYSGYL